MEIHVFVYSRMDSRRFPGKAMSIVNSEPLVKRVLRRATMVHATRCLLLTTNRSIDRPLVREADSLGIDYLASDHVEPINRTKQAIGAFGTDVFVRVNGDSPLFEPSIVNFALSNAAPDKMLSNLTRRRFPYGVAAEIVGTELFIRSIRESDSPIDEHLTGAIYKSFPNQISTISQTRNDSDLRLTVDYAHDLARLNNIVGSSPTDATYWDLLHRLPPNLSIVEAEFKELPGVAKQAHDLGKGNR